MHDSKFMESSSEEDEAEIEAKQEYQKKQELAKLGDSASRKSVNLNLLKVNKKKSMYDSDTNHNNHGSEG